jgi:hypothetical protein
MDDDLLLAALLRPLPPAATGKPLATLQIAPASAEGLVEAAYAIALRNGGASAASFMLSADDRARRLNYELGTERATIPPGQTAHIPLVIEAPRKLVGAAEAIRFTVYAEPETGPALTAEATFLHRPALSARAAVLVGAMILLATLGALLLDRFPQDTPRPAQQPTSLPSGAPGSPLIAAFAASPASVAPGEPVLIYWDVRGADQVTIEPFGAVAPLGQREFQPTESSDLRLEARSGDKTTIALLRVVVEP